MAIQLTRAGINYYDFRFRTEDASSQSSSYLFLAAGVDATKIQPDNPFSKSGGTASMLQAAVSEINPAQAARWCVDAGQGLSIATMAEMQSGGELSERAMEDLWNNDAAFVTDRIKQKLKQRQNAEERHRSWTVSSGLLKTDDCAKAHLSG